MLSSRRLQSSTRLSAGAAVMQRQVPRIQTAVKTAEAAVRRDSGGCARDHADHAGYRRARGYATTGPSGSDCAEDGGSPAEAVRRQDGGGACDHAVAPGYMGHIVEVPLPHAAAKIPEVVETTPQERTWCIFEDAGYDATSLPQPDGVAGALAWLTSRPARVDQAIATHEP